MRPISPRVFSVFLVATAIACLLPVAALAQNTIYSFTTCGQTGPTGPSQSSCDSDYSGTPLAGNVTVTGGIQQWTVPADGRYRIEAWGGEGGTQTFAPGFPGGKGAYASGEFDLTAGETINIIVGQRGEDTRAQVDNAAPGGGGGSFVYVTATDAFPLIAAGGGGSGARCTSVSPLLQNANGTTAGNRSGTHNNGGSGGNGGRNNVGGSSYWAGGGAGWLTNGTGGDNPVDYDFTPAPTDGAEGGRAPRNGANGGIRWNDGNDEGGDGGFGGGGGGGSDNMGGGGGGGFSGGGGANGDDCGNEPGGGAGSYSGGESAVLTGGVNAADGSVIITAIFQPVPAVSTMGMLFLVILLAAAGALTVRMS